MRLLRLVPDETKIQFMRGRFAGVITSAVLGTISVVLFFYPGLNLGVDFRGGVVAELRKPPTMTTETIRHAREVSSGRPVWIILSPANEPIVRSIWTEHPQQDYRIGVTGLKFEPSRAAEDHFLVEIDTLDIHHGPYSTEKPYTELEVIGCHLTQPIRTELSELGFAQFDEQATGFIAKRSREEAAIRRRQ